MPSRGRWAWGLVSVASMLLTGLLTGCDGDDSVAEGERVFTRRLSDGNEMTCSTCHAIEEPSPDGFRRVAHSLRDAARRPSYKGGRVSEMRDAANSCVTEWMAGFELGAFDPRWTALEAYLRAQAPAGAAPALTFEIVPPPADLSGGEVAAGEALFGQTCALCHGEGGMGTLRAPILRGAELDEGLISRRVRLGGSPDSAVYDGLIGGEMPFWSADRLSDDELRDLIAYVLSISVRPVDDGGTPDAGL